MLTALGLLAGVISLTSCEKLKKEMREAKSQQERRVTSSKCCWCVDRETKENVLTTFTSNSACEKMAGKGSLSECKGVEIESKSCSFQKPIVGPKNSITFRREDLKIRNSKDYISSVVAQPFHCDRSLTSNGIPQESSDARCQSERCRCYPDSSLPWYCQLVLEKKDGTKEILGTRAKPDRDSLCNPALCRDLFYKEVRAFCPVIE